VLQTQIALLAIRAFLRPRAPPARVANSSPVFKNGVFVFLPVVPHWHFRFLASPIWFPNSRFQGRPEPSYRGHHDSLQNLLPFAHSAPNRPLPLPTGIKKKPPDNPPINELGCPPFKFKSLVRPRVCFPELNPILLTYVFFALSVKLIKIPLSLLIFYVGPGSC